jgi:hypothetical protein
MLRHTDNGLQVFRVSGASPIPFGDPLPGAIETPAGQQISFNRVIQFQGDVYAVADDGVFKKDDPTSDAGAWTQDHTFLLAAAATVRQHTTGIYQIVLSGVPTLYVLYPSTGSSSSWTGALLNGNTDVWSETSEQVSVTHTASIDYGTELIYRGVLYRASAGDLLTFDPGAESIGSIDLGDLSAAGERVGIGIFNDRLLLIGRDTPSTEVALFEVTGGGVSLLVTVPSSLAHAASLMEMRHALFPSPDGAVLYAAVSDATGGIGNHFYKFIDTAGTISFDSDLADPVLPAGLRVGGGSPADTNRWWVFYDQETTVGVAKCLIYFAPDDAPGSILTQYAFVDESTVITQEDSGGSASWAAAAVMTGGGERIFTPGEMNIQVVERLAVFGGEALRFKAWGATGADKSVNFRLNTETEVPLLLATLSGTPTVVSGPAPAPTRNVNTLEGVTADGTTIYQTVWDIATDGLVSGQRAQLVPRVFV